MKRILVLSALLLATSAANAVTIDFAGTISNVDDPTGLLSGSGIAAGSSTFSGTFSYDPTAAPFATSSDAASYWGVSFSVTIDGTIDMADSPPVVTVANDNSSGDVFFIGSSGPIDVYELPIAGFTQFFINLIDASGSLYGSTALPNSLALTDFGFRRFAVRSAPGSDGYGLDGDIESLTVVGVPEPGALGIVFVGLIALALARPRRRGV